MIKMMDRGSILNSKIGFNRCSIPWLGVMVGDKEHEDRARTGPPTLTDNDVEIVLTEKARKSKLREREDTARHPSVRGEETLALL